MRVLALSHSAVVSAYREKFRRLAMRKGWDLHLVMPHAWPEGGKDVRGALARHGEGKAACRSMCCGVACGAALVSRPWLV